MKSTTNVSILRATIEYSDSSKLLHKVASCLEEDSDMNQDAIYSLLTDTLEELMGTNNFKLNIKINSITSGYLLSSPNVVLRSAVEVIGGSGVTTMVIFNTNAPERASVVTFNPLSDSMIEVNVAHINSGVYMIHVDVHINRSVDMVHCDIHVNSEP